MVVANLRDMELREHRTVLGHPLFLDRWHYFFTKVDS